jgi:hypothetical protein
MGLSKDWDSGLGFGDNSSWAMWWVPAWVGLPWMRGDCCVGFQSIFSFFILFFSLIGWWIGFVWWLRVGCLDIG